VTNAAGSKTPCGRRLFLTTVGGGILMEGNHAYARLRANPEAWAEELKERKAWEGTLADGLQDSE
jgi:hypothetical protein